MIVAWLWSAALAGSPEDAVVPLSPVAATFWEEGLRLEREGEPGAAALRFRAVLAADPSWGPATVALARALVADDRTDDALAALRDRPFDADAVEAQAELLASLGRWPEAAESWQVLAGLRPEWPAAHLRRADALRHTDVVGAAAELRGYLAFSGVDPAADGLAPVAAAVADELRATGRRDEAARLVELVLAVDPGQADALGELLVRIEVDALADALGAAGTVPLLPPQRARLDAARAALDAGALDAARRELEVLALDAPAAPEVWDALSRAREAQGDVAGAEAAIRAASQLDPRSAAYAARRGDLLSRFGGRFDAEAAAAFAAATRRAPDDPELWFRRGEAERRAGRWRAGAASMERCLRLDPRGPRAEAARRVVEGAVADLEAPPEVPPAVGRPASVPEAAWRAWLLAQAWADRDVAGPGPDPRAEALRELAYVREHAPAFEPALRLEAALRAETGDAAAAAALWGELAALDPRDPEPLAHLATLAERAGDGARAAAAWEEAADRGHGGGLLRRARAQEAALRWWSALGTAREAAARATDPDDRAAAVALGGLLQRRLVGCAVGITLLVLTLLGLPLLGALRRRSGRDLDALLAASPGSWREVARVVSAVQHEVVKHHFGLLEPVADALSDRDPDPARFAAERWYGPQGALAQLRSYVAELEALGRRAGVPVNLRWRDARFGPLLEAAEGLAALEPAVRSGGGPALADALRTLAGPLGRDAHASLAGLVRALCVLRVDEALLREVFAAAMGEFPGRRSTLEVRAPAGGVLVRMFRADFRDVVGNLVRNAAEATPADQGVVVGLLLTVEEDPVTFAERAVLAVADGAPGELTTADLRGRHLNRGLGLAVDLVAAAGGAVSVEGREGYAKAVVVRVPRVE